MPPTRRHVTQQPGTTANAGHQQIHRTIAIHVADGQAATDVGDAAQDAIAY